ncbi:hypothetical protein TNCV_1827281 [Trichonephila clavipes]|nr:hypothetical protein TNCV_1827281 [Trichonephila clavipes]
MPPPTMECAGHQAKTRHGTRSTPRIRARIQRLSPTPRICSTNPTAMSLRRHRRETGKRKEELNDKEGRK